MTILDEIVASKREEVARLRAIKPLDAVRDEAVGAAETMPPRDLVAALSRPGVSLIAEIKRVSPSKGLLRPDLDPAALAREYEAAGAAAISVLTDAPYFRGSLDDLRAVRAQSRLPVLRKDFVIDAYQVYEARAAGADAVLLIAAVLDETALGSLYEITRALGMDALVEVHDAAELARACTIGARIVGVNNRDLHTFETDLNTTLRLSSLVPDGTLLVSESGIHGPADVERLAAAGADAMLVGEALVRAESPAGQIRRLLTGADARPRVKICGLTNLDDARCAAAAGADLLGFIFFPGSARCVTPQQAGEITAALRRECDGQVPRFVGVFVNEPAEQVRAVLDTAGLDLAQLHGDEEPAQLRQFGPRAFKALRPDSLAGAQAAAARFHDAVHDAASAAASTGRALPQFLADAYHPEQYGGTGRPADVEAAHWLARRYRLLLAGGLAPDNVAAAVEQVRPWGVDVSSGVERAKGLKDHGRVRAFVEAAKLNGGVR